MNLVGKHILLGITGGIAAYKSVQLLRLLQEQGAEVRVIATPSALRFIGEETLKALSRNEVAVGIFSDKPDSDWTKHIHWGEWSDLMVIAPCTANTLAKIAHGFSDNMLTATVLALRSPILICPTMDGEMYSSASTQLNLKQVKQFGFHVMEPETGYLASGLTAKGRLPEPESIVNEIISLIHPKPKWLSGKKVLITVGATREFFDPVRFISNPSTGKMGMALASAAIELGADVTLIKAFTEVGAPENCKIISVTTAEDIFHAVENEFPKTDIGIFTAAVSDYTPVETFQHKIKKQDSELVINLKKTPDSLAWAGSQKKATQFLAGFAMETQDLEENARAKLLKKSCDCIIANELKTGISGFATDSNKVLFITNSKTMSFEGKKSEISFSILQAIASQI